MRNESRLTLLAMLAITASVLAAPSALAQTTEPLAHDQTPLLVVQQEIHAASDATCAAVTPSPPPVPAPLLTSGGCRVHIASIGNVVFVDHLSAGGTESITAICTIEMDMRIDTSGEGYFTHQELTGTECVKRPCGQVTPPTGEGRAWSFYSQEQEVFPREAMTVPICLEPLNMTAPIHCEIVMEITEATTHRHQLVANDASGHGGALPHCEVDGVLRFEGAAGVTGEAQGWQRVEIRHN